MTQTDLIRDRRLQRLLHQQPGKAPACVVCGDRLRALRAPLALQDEPALAARLVAAAAGAPGRWPHAVVAPPPRSTSGMRLAQPHPAASCPPITIGRKRRRPRSASAWPVTRATTLAARPRPAVGKRLALEVAHRLAICADGARFVELAPVEQANQVPAALALALGLDGREEPAVQIVAHLRRKKLLLVLDNLEHTAGLRAVHQTPPGSARTCTSSPPARAPASAPSSALQSGAAGAGCCRRRSLENGLPPMGRTSPATKSPRYRTINQAKLPGQRMRCAVSVLAGVAGLHDQLLPTRPSATSMLTAAARQDRSFTGGFEEDAVRLGFDTAALRALDDKHLWCGR